MGANDLILNLHESGFSINVGNSCLQVSPAKKLSNELKQTIRQSKVEILCALHQEEELTRLVRLVSDHHGFSQEDYEEALKFALGDQVSALICYTELANKAELI